MKNEEHDLLVEALAALNEVIPYADELQDAGPWGSGWQSDALVASVCRAKAVELKLQAHLARRAVNPPLNTPT